MFLTNSPNSKGLVGSVGLEGSLPVLGNFKLEVTTGPETNSPPLLVNTDEWAQRPLDRTMYMAGNLPKGQIWKAKGNESSVFWR